MKKLFCVLLSIITVLLLGACGRTDGQKNTAPAQTLPVQTTVPTEMDSVPQQTAAAATQTTEPEFTSVTLFEDANYGKVQITDLYPGLETGTPCHFAEFTVSNNSGGTLLCELGGTVYMNDLMVTPVAMAKMNESHAGQILLNGSFSYTGRVEKGQEVVFERVLPYNLQENVAVDISVHIVYDNGETGVYQEQVELFNELVRIHGSENPVSEKYISTGTELYAAKSDAYKLFATECGENKETYPARYWVYLYLENTHDRDVVFSFDDFVSVSSDRQENPYYLASSGIFYLDYAADQIRLAPGKGCYLQASVSKEKVDGFAKDINEVVAVSIPVCVWEVPDGESTAGDWSEEHVVRITRAQFVHGAAAPAPEPVTEPATEPATEPVTEPATEPAAEPATEPTEEEIPDDPGDIGHGGAPDPNHVHLYTTTIRNPTCTNGGFTAYTCYCGDTHLDDFTEPSGHEYKETVVEPTEESEGYTEYYCWRCCDTYRDHFTKKRSA